MNVLEFISSFVWPVVAILAIVLFRKPITLLLLSLRSFKWGDFAAQFEVEDDKLPRGIKNTDTENAVVILQGALSRGAHSYKWIRDNTPLAMTDEELDDIIKNFPHAFESTRIVKRDSEGNRVIPGNPGMRLKSAT